MSHKTRWLGVVVVLMAAAAWVAQSARELKATRTALEGLGQRRYLLEQESQRLEKAAADRKRSARANLDAPKTAGSAKTPDISGQGRVGDKKLLALLQNPKLQAEYLTAKRARLSRTYGPLFRSLKLSPDQTARFEAIAMQREEQVLDIVGTMPKVIRLSRTGSQWDTSLESLSVGGPATDPDTQAAAELQRQANQAFKTAASDLLGTDGYAQLNDYERAMPARKLTDDLANELAATGSPLDLEEADQMTQLLASASLSYAKGGEANLGQVDWDKILAKAQGVLSPPQAAGLARIVALNQAQMHLRTLLQHATGAAR